MLAHRSGFVLATVLICLTLTVVMVGTALSVGTAQRRSVRNDEVSLQARLAAEAGLERAVSRTWRDVLDRQGADPSLATYRAALDDVLADGTSREFSGPLADSSFAVRVTRTDQPDRTELLVVSTGRSPDGQGRRELREKLSVVSESGEFGRYALLTERSGCALCATEIVGPTSGSGAGDGGVTVGLLSLPRDVADARIAGSVHVRVGEEVRTPPAEFSDGLRLLSPDLPLGPSGPSSQRTALVSPTLRDCRREACTAGANLYLHPLPERTSWTSGRGGALPDRVSPVAPDLDGNRDIDDAEWNRMVQDVVKREGRLGTVVATYSRRVSPPSGLFGAPAESFPAQRAAPTPESSGHLVVAGDIEVRGTVLIDGDLVIGGHVRGRGRIVARGNVYVPGDLRSDCASLPGLQACDGETSPSSVLPRLTLASAGGAVLLGQEFVRGFGSPDDAGAASSAALRRQLADFNREERDRALDAVGFPGHVPRFYRIREDQPIFFARRGDRWGAEAFDTIPACPQGAACGRGENASNDALPDRARVVTLAVPDGWFTEADGHALGLRTSTGGEVATVRVDARLHAGQAIVVVPPDCRSACGPTSASGTVVVEGVMHAPDLMLIAPERTDRRVVDGHREPALRLRQDPRTDPDADPVSLLRTRLDAAGEAP